MKNLKKVLALVLVFAMSLTLFAGAADFSDQADIRTSVSEAVDTLVALGIINGYSDGSFRPDDTVTRAEMAKMIYAVRTGTDSATGFEGANTTFTDINGHWAAGYIKFCQSMGIIAGRSATQFDPDAIVTTQEAAKMLLVTLGYDADTAGLTGSNWAGTTLALATENGLLDKVTVDVAGNLPRQYAAQLIFNAIEADTVTLENGAYVRKETTKTVSKEVETSQTQVYYTVKGDTTNTRYYDYSVALDAANNDKTLVVTNTVPVTTWVNETATTYETMGEKYLKLKSDEVILTYVQKDSGKDTYTIKAGGITFTKVEKDYSDYLRQEVKVLYKDTDEVYGLFATNSNEVVITGAGDDFDTVTGNRSRVKFDGKEYKLATTIDKLIVYPTGVYSADADKAYTLEDLLSDGHKTSQITLIANNDTDTIQTGIVTPVEVRKVTYVGSSSITFSRVAGSGAGSVDTEDLNVYDGIAKDDYVVFTTADFTVDNKDTVTKASVVSGAATGVRSNEVQVGGTWYKGISTASLPTFNINTSYDLVVIGKYVYHAEKTSSGSVEDILYVDAIDQKYGAGSTTKGEAIVYFGDGSSATITISELIDDGTDVLPSLLKKAGAPTISKTWADYEQMLFAYEISSGEYELTLVGYKNSNGEKETAGYDDYKDKLTYNNKRLGGLAIEDDAVIFVNADKKSGSGKEVKVLSGKTVSGWGTKTATLTTAKSTGLVGETNGISYIKVAAITIDGTIPTGSGTEAYGILTADPYQTKNAAGDRVVMLEIWNGSETITAEWDKSDTSLKKGNAVIYDAVSSTEVDDVKLLTDDKYGAKAAIFVNSSGSVVRAVTNTGDLTTATYAKGTEYYTEDESLTVTSDTKIVYIDGNKAGSSDYRGQSAEELVDYSETDTVYYANAYVLIDADEDHELLAVIYDVNNYLKDKKDLVTIKNNKTASTKYTVTTNVNGVEEDAKNITNNTIAQTVTVQFDVTADITANLITASTNSTNANAVVQGVTGGKATIVTTVASGNTTNIVVSVVVAQPTYTVTENAVTDNRTGTPAAHGVTYSVSKNTGVTYGEEVVITVENPNSVKFTVAAGGSTITAETDGTYKATITADTAIDVTVIDD